MSMLGAGIVASLCLIPLLLLLVAQSLRKSASCVLLMTGWLCMSNILSIVRLSVDGNKDVNQKVTLLKNTSQVLSGCLVGISGSSVCIGTYNLHSILTFPLTSPKMKKYHFFHDMIFAMLLPIIVLACYSAYGCDNEAERGRFLLGFPCIKFSASGIFGNLVWAPYLFMMSLLQSATLLYLSWRNRGIKYPPQFLPLRIISANLLITLTGFPLSAVLQQGSKSLSYNTSLPKACASIWQWIWPILTLIWMSCLMFSKEEMEPYWHRLSQYKQQKVLNVKRKETIRDVGSAFWDKSEFRKNKPKHESTPPASIDTASITSESERDDNDSQVSATEGTSGSASPVSVTHQEPSGPRKTVRLIGHKRSLRRKPPPTGENFPQERDFMETIADLHEYPQVTSNQKTLPSLPPSDIPARHEVFNSDNSRADVTESPAPSSAVSFDGEETNGNGHFAPHAYPKSRHIAEVERPGTILISAHSSMWNTDFVYDAEDVEDNRSSVPEKVTSEAIESSADRDETAIQDMPTVSPETETGTAGGPSSWGNSPSAMGWKQSTPRWARQRNSSGASTHR